VFAYLVVQNQRLMETPGYGTATANINKWKEKMWYGSTQKIPKILSKRPKLKTKNLIWRFGLNTQTTCLKIAALSQQCGLLVGLWHNRHTRSINKMKLLTKWLREEYFLRLLLPDQALHRRDILHQTSPQKGPARHFWEQWLLKSFNGIYTLRMLDWVKKLRCWGSN
jgi:hypothetical protein